MSSFDEMLKTMKSAVARSGGNYIRGAGVFEVELVSTQRKMAFNETFTVRNKELFIAEFRIISVKSNDPEVLKTHLEGTTASWTCKDPSTANAGDVKAFVVAACGKDPKQLRPTDDEANLQAALLSLAALGEAQAFEQLGLSPDFFVGRRLKLETLTVLKKDGKPFTRHVWSPITA